MQTRAGIERARRAMTMQRDRQQDSSRAVAPQWAVVGAVSGDLVAVSVGTVSTTPGQLIARAAGPRIKIGDTGVLYTTNGGGLFFVKAGGGLGLADVFDVRDFGALGDGGDDQPAMQACSDACETAGGVFYVPPGMTFTIGSTLDLRYLKSVQSFGTIEVEHTSGVGVIVGNNSGGQPQEIFFHDVKWAGSQSNPCIRIVGLKDNRVTIEASSYVEYYADGNVVADAGSYYNDIECGYIKNIVYNAVNSGALNETRWWGGRLVDLTISGNHNRFYDNSFESSTIVFAATAENCAILHARFEGTCTIDFDADTTDNVVQQSWASIASTIWPTPTVTDAGFNNRVYLEKQEGDTDTVWRADAASRLTDVAGPWFAGTTDVDYLEPGLVKILMPASSNDFADTGIFPLEVGNLARSGSQARIWVWASDQAYWRPRVFVYDVNRVLLTDGGTTDYIRLTGGWVWDATNNCYSFNSNQSGPHRIVFDEMTTAKYARIVMRSGNPSQPAWFEYVELMAYVSIPRGNQIVDFVRRQMAQPLASDTTPAKALLALGDKIVTTTGDRIVTYRLDTTLTANSPVADTTLTVASIGTAANGDLVAIELDNGQTDWTTVSGAPSGSTITIATGLSSAAASGRRVVVVRFGSIT